MTVYCKHGCRYWYIQWISLVGIFTWFSTCKILFGIFSTFYLLTVIVEDIISCCKELLFGQYHIWHNGLKNVDRFLTIRKRRSKLRSYKAPSRIVKSESNNVLIVFSHGWRVILLVTKWLTFRFYLVNVRSLSPNFNTVKNILIIYGQINFHAKWQNWETFTWLTSDSGIRKLCGGLKKH